MTSKLLNEYGIYGAGKWNTGTLKMPQFSHPFIYIKIPKKSGGTQITSPEDSCAPIPGDFFTDFIKFRHQHWILPILYYQPNNIDKL
jgi:hypothetical protein